MKKLLEKYLKDLTENAKKNSTEEEIEDLANNKLKELLIMSVLTYTPMYTRVSIEGLIEQKINYLALIDFKETPTTIADELVNRLGILGINFGIKEDKIGFNNTSEDFAIDLVKGMADVKFATNEYSSSVDLFKKHLHQCLKASNWLIHGSKKMKEKNMDDAVNKHNGKTFKNWEVKLTGFDKFSELLSYAIIPYAEHCKDAKVFDKVKKLMVDHCYQYINEFNFNYGLYHNNDLLQYKLKINNDYKALDQKQILLKKKEAEDILNTEIDAASKRLKINLDYGKNTKKIEIKNNDLITNVINLKVKEQKETDKHLYENHCKEYIKNAARILTIIIAPKQISNLNIVYSDIEKSLLNNKILYKKEFKSKK